MFTDSLTGVAAVAFLLVDGNDYSIHLLIHISRTGFHAFTAVGAFFSVDNHFPHLPELSVEIYFI